jgi:LEA14-like dessication related protein
MGCDKPKPPTIKPKRVDIIGTDPNGLVLRVYCVAHNPNPVPLPVRKVDAKVEMSSIPMGDVTATSTTTLAARSDTNIVVDVKAPWSSVGATIPKLASQPQVPYTVEGTARLEAAGLKFDIPFTTKGTLPREQLVAAVARFLSPLPIPIPKIQ